MRVPLIIFMMMIALSTYSYAEETKQNAAKKVVHRTPLGSHFHMRSGCVSYAAILEEAHDSPRGGRAVTGRSPSRLC